MCLSVIGLLLGGLDLTGLLLAALLVFLVGLLEWRRRPQICSIQLSTAVIRCTLSDGKQLEAGWPISGMANRYWVSFAMPTQFRRRLWLTVYCDQLCADDFRHLRIMMRR
ncbi:MAG: hypothetical protein V2I38_09775 [Alcanivoracaceae bacterium]|nr:hypothetical protein [Alcanivoracaceae bacterium]